MNSIAVSEISRHIVKAAERIDSLTSEREGMEKYQIKSASPTIGAAFEQSIFDELEILQISVLTLTNLLVGDDSGDTSDSEDKSSTQEEQETNPAK